MMSLPCLRREYAGLYFQLNRRRGRQVAELAELLDLERKSNTDLRRDLAELSSELQSSLSQRDEMQSQMTFLGEELADARKSVEDERAKLAEKLADAYKVVDANKAKVEIQLRKLAALEQDIAPIAEFEPALAIGTTPVVQKAKELSIPALYFTNLISARPLMGPAGAGSLATVINAALANKARFDTMTAFFEGVGHGDTAGVWEGTPNVRPDFKTKYAARVASQSKKVVEGSVGC